MNARFRDALPAIRGTFVENAALKDIVWFRAGGPAEILFRPADVDDLRTFLAQKPPKMPVSVIGVGSNLLVRDGGIKGVVIRLPASFGKIASSMSIPVKTWRSRVLVRRARSPIFCQGVGDSNLPSA